MMSWLPPGRRRSRACSPNLGRMTLRHWGRAVALGASVLSLAGCERALPGQLAGCQVYRPHLAKRTFDGRVGSVLLRNASPGAVEVKFYHPDALGDVELRRRVPAGALLVLQGSDESRLALGNDWGIQVEQSCVRTLGQAAAWAPGEFSLRWEGDSLRAGLGDDGQSDRLGRPSREPGQASDAPDQPRAVSGHPTP